MTNPPPLKTVSPEALVWIQTSFLGDIILTTSAIQLARSQWPKCKQIVITTPVGAAALEGQPFVDELIAWDKRGESIWQGLGKIKRRLDHYFSKASISVKNAYTIRVHKSLRSGLLAHRIGLPVLTYRESSLSFLAHQTVPRLAVLHEAQRISLLLEPLGVSRQQVLSARPFLAVSPSRQSKDSHYTQVLKQLEAQKSKQGRRGRIFGIAPGSVWGTKRWPANSYAHLISDLLDRDEYLQIVLIGSPAERQQSEQILSSVKNERFFDLVGHTKISDLPQLIATLDILVANDSSPLHYAAAVDTPTVAIFGATTPSLGFGPLAQKKVIVESPDSLPCRPCSDHGPQVCPLKHFDCMRTITVGAVRDAIDRLIKA